MANKRMFSLDVVDTDLFLEMPTTTQALYFHLGMRADDDGFVSSPKKIAKLSNCTMDDLKILISKGFVIPFESGIVVITHWKVNNYIPKDRYHETINKNEKKQLSVFDMVYKLDTSCIHDVYQMPTNGIPNDNKLDTQVRLGKDSIGKDNINTICPEPEKPAPDRKPEDESGILLSLVDGTEYNVPLSKIENWSTAFPAVDVKQELLKMASWLDSNPKNRKTRRGINHFINNWLSRTQDRGGTRKAAVQAVQVQKPPTRFNNFDQRTYDYPDLERKLLNSQENGK